MIAGCLFHGKALLRHTHLHSLMYSDGLARVHLAQGWTAIGGVAVPSSNFGHSLASPRDRSSGELHNRCRGPGSGGLRCSK